LLGSHALPNIRVALTGEVRRIVLSEKYAVVPKHLPRTRMNQARKSINPSGWDRLGTWLGRRGSRNHRTAG
jgi:hypothetical protein